MKLTLIFISKKIGKITLKDTNVAGFAYNPIEDSFYATKNAWQKEFGYSHLYDVSAPFFRMIIDTEPIHFFYNNKHWLISFWKGQYGITTGAEIGVYATEEHPIHKNTLYLPISNQEMLDMHFILYKKKEKIIDACGKHWWLARFKLGMFSKPKDLTMDIRITFPNKEMLEAFLVGIKKLKYKKKDYKIINNSFLFTFRKSHSKKVWTRFWLTDAIINHQNHNNVKRYNRYAKDLLTKENTPYKVQDFIPQILQNKEYEEQKRNAEENVVFLNEEVYTNLKDEYDK